MNTAAHMIWAKSSPFMSLWTHSICTGICAEVFLKAGSSARLLNYLSERFGFGEEESVHLIAYLASVHDIGKAHPAFQSKDKACLQRVIDVAPEYFDNRFAEAPIQSFRHEHYSGAVLARIWKAKGYSRQLSRLLSTVVSLHHQKPKDRMSTVEPRNPAWKDMQDSLEADLSGEFLHDVPLKQPDRADAVCMLISSIIILMDWVASSELFHDAESMTVESIPVQAEKTLRLYGLISDDAFPVVESFSSLFPAIAHPRPLQEGCIALQPCAALTIIEAPMGEGKTEAALYLAARQCNAVGGRGIYMALPSQATSNQIHARFDSMLADLNYGQSRLLHGTAFLSQQKPDGFMTEDEESAAKWTRPLRMGFLGANAVGTVDQAMSTVLRSRFSMIRLLGLSNKVLIIDEIHAYDLYMSQIIETLLHWCHICEIPVILLSATMQMTQKRRYLSCFNAGSSEEVQSDYPLLTQVLPQGTLKQKAIDSSAHYYYQFHPVRMDFDPAAISDMGLQMVDGGGCIAIMVNTVKHAQDVFQALRAKAEEDLSVQLFHSRYTLRRRNEIEGQCVRSFGRERIHRPHKAILVATQVVEQSIDLDFDGMISELAPVDLLLQRAGRLHRHRDNIRPAAFREPTLHVLVPSETAPSDLNERYGASGYVYDPFLLYNTEQQMKETRTVHIPEDIRSLVEETYASITDVNREAWLKRSMRGILETAKAKGCTWPIPQEDSFFPAEETVYYDIPDNDDGMDSSSEASTRIGDSGLRIAFCSEEDFDHFSDCDIPPAEQTKIYLNSVQVRLTAPQLVGNAAACVRRGKLAGIWLLRGMKDVELDNCVIHNDDESGVRWEVK